MVLKTLKLILVFFSFTLIVALVSRQEIKEIQCVSQDGSCESKVIEDINSAKPLTLGTFGKKLKTVLLTNVFVDKYQTQLVLPGKVVVTIVQKEPRYELLNEKGGSRLLIDKDGFVLISSSQGRFFPVTFEAENSPEIGSRVSDKTLFALKTTYLVHKNYELSKAMIKGDALEIELPQGVKTIFPLEGDLDYLTGGFVLLYNRLNKDGNEFRIDNDKISQIDLRFKNPVLIKQI